MDRGETLYKSSLNSNCLISQPISTASILRCIIPPSSLRIQFNLDSLNRLTGYSVHACAPSRFPSHNRVQITCLASTTAKTYSKEFLKGWNKFKSFEKIFFSRDYCTWNIEGFRSSARGDLCPHVINYYTTDSSRLRRIIQIRSIIGEPWEISLEQILQRIPRRWRLTGFEGNPAI